MGCFNTLGFFSKTPIKYHDDIVLFICAGYTGTTGTLNPLNTIDHIFPIALPIFGKYNEYGGIEDVFSDVNTNYLSEAFGCDIEKFIEYLSVCSDIPLKSLRTMSGTDPFRDPAYTKIADVITGLGLTKYENCAKPYPVDKNIFDDSVNNTNVNPEDPYTRDNMYLTYCIERRSVFNILADSNTFTEYKDGYISFTRLIDVADIKINILDTSKPLDVYDIVTNIRYRINNGDEMLAGRIKELGINLSSILHRDFRTAIHHDYAYDLIAYNKCEYTNLYVWRPLIFNFVDFSFSLDNVGGYFCHSAYGSQTISKYKEVFKALFTEYYDILKTLDN